MVLVYLPLFVATFFIVVLALEPVSRRLEIAFTSIAYKLFGGLEVEVDEERRSKLKAAGIGTPYRIYWTKTYLYSVVVAFVGAVYGVYIGAAVLRLLGIESLSERVPDSLASELPEFLLSISAKEASVVFGTSVLLGTVAFGVVYFVRWQIPVFRADTRKRQIDASMPRMVAFIYALSRGGMALPNVMEALARNEGVFGAGAREMSVGVRDIELFNSDVVSTVRMTARRTPSESLRTFMENLSSVLQSGRNFSDFLAEEYRRYREEAEEQQAEILELLATTAEVYVTVVVAGMLFLITILFVIGITSGDTLVLVQLITYVVLPATNVLFMAYLAEITQPLKATRERGDSIDNLEDSRIREDELAVEAGGGSTRGAASGDVAATDGGEPSAARGASSGPVSDGGVARADRYAPLAGTDDDANRARLLTYKRIEGIQDSLSAPIESLVARPELLLFVTVPLALGFVAVQFPTILLEGFDVRALDDVLVLATLFVLGTYAAVYEVSRYRLEKLEHSLPDMLERLASLNEAGVSIVSSFNRVRRTDIGDLDEEAERIWRDIQWGATVEQALDRFQKRVETPSVTRTVTLITNAMRASNEIGPVLRIAAEQARADRQLKRQRKQEMLTYLVVIYVAFIVFVVVIAAIDTVLIPNLPERPTTETGATVGGLLQVSRSGTEAYRLTFLHAALIQSTLSGLVGGLMGNGSIKDGAKHATVMLGATYVIFLVLTSINVAP